MRTIVTILLLVFSPLVLSAGDTEVKFLIGAYHWSAKNETRNDTYGLNVSHKGLDVYLYRNSFGQMTQAFGYKKTWSIVDHISVSLTTGVVYGYGYTTGSFSYNNAAVYGGRRVMPFVLPSVTVEYQDVLASVHVFTAGAAFSVGYRF